MLRTLMFGIPLVLLCLSFQAYFVVVCARQYAAVMDKHAVILSTWRQVLLLGLVMCLMLLSNIIQMAVWAVLFVVLDEFADFQTAMYHSAVNFATLGYGDIVMSERWRILGPMEAAVGILMFGVSTAVMTAAIMDLLQRARARRDAASGDQPGTR
jgi:hypothetical protein